MDKQSTIQFRVRYQETDRMGVVHHSVPYIWYEMGRTEWLRERGISYSECEAKGWLLPVIESGTKYISPATYDDLIEVVTVYKPEAGVVFRFEYQVRNLSQQGKIMAYGFTRHVCVNRESKIDKTVTRELKAILK